MGKGKKDEKMDKKIIDKLFTLTIEELDNYSDFLTNIYHDGLTEDELNAKILEYLGLEGKE